MTKTYTRITLKERFEIEKMLSHNKSFTDIAFTLSRHKSSISREVNTYGRKSYNASKAQLKSTLNSSTRRYDKTKMNQCVALKKCVLNHLKNRWSPFLISTMLSKEFNDEKNMQLSAETIYVHIYYYNAGKQRTKLINLLLQHRRSRGNIRRGADKRTTIANKVSIDERPADVDSRLIPGHWEGDLIIGKEGKSAIGTIVERTTRALILVHIKSKDALTVRKAFEKAFKNIPRHMKKSLTYDNGSEMAQHVLFTKNTKIDFFFANTHSPWQRGTNENTNGLLRAYFPKGTDLSLITRRQLLVVQNNLNDRPRKVLNYQTPKEVFLKFAQEKK